MGASLQVDSEWESVSKQLVASPNAAVSGRNMCYIIFTSGSTGRPKGAVLQHAGVINYLHCLTRCVFRVHDLGNGGMTMPMPILIPVLASRVTLSASVRVQ